MQSSVTSLRARSGRSARRFSSSADALATGEGSGCSGFELIDGPEVEIPRDEDLDAIPLVLGDRGWDVDGALQHLGEHVLRARGVIDHGAARAAGGHGRLHRAVDHRDEERRTETLEEVSVDLAREARATELI